MYDDDEDLIGEYDIEDDSESQVLSCPSCGASVYEETQQCPHCGDWITPHAASARLPLWVRIAGAVVAAGFIFALLRGVFRLF